VSLRYRWICRHGQSGTCRGEGDGRILAAKLWQALALRPASDNDCTYVTRGCVLISIVFTNPLEATVNFHLASASSERKLPVLVVFVHEHRKENDTHDHVKPVGEQKSEHGVQKRPMYCAYAHSCIKRRFPRNLALAAKPFRSTATHAFPTN